MATTRVKFLEKGTL